MKRIILGVASGIFAVLMASGGANAQAQSGSTLDNNVGVNVQTFGSEIPKRTRVTTTGSAIAPGLTAGAIVCAQSTSVGGGFMGGAFAIGTTRKDDDCNGRAWIATMGAMAGATSDGRYIQAAHNIACGLDMPGQALRQAGFACPGDRVRVAAAPQQRVVRGLTAKFAGEANRRDRAVDLQVTQSYGYPKGTKVAKAGKKGRQLAEAARAYNHTENRWMTRDATGRWIY